MSLKFRRAFFYLYIGLFLIAAPVVVLFTAGYRFNFSTGRLVQVGALSVTSEPRGATIFLDDDELPSKTPAVANRVIPGTYKLRLDKEGYKSWEREVEIKSRQTALIENAVLFLDVQPEKMLDLAPTVSSASPDGSLVAYGVLADPWFELWQYEIANNNFVLLDRQSAAKVTAPELFWTHDGVLQGPGIDPPESFADYVFEREGEQIALIKLDDEADGRPTIALLPIDEYTVVDAFDRYVLVRGSNDRLLLIDTVTDGPPILLNTTAEFYRWSGTTLFYSDGFELNQYDPTSNTDKLITRSGTHLTDVLSFPIGRTILVVSETSVTAMDMSDESRPVITTIIQAEAMQTFWTDERGRTGYFFGTMNGESGLYRLRLTR